MSAPDLIVQTPGEPVASSAPAAPNAATTSQQDPAPAAVPYAGKHNGGGRWIVITNDEKAARVGEFVGTKESIIPEVERMNAGGDPFVAPAGDSQAPAAVPKQVAGAIDPTTINQAVMTEEGWLCPETKAKE